MNQNMSYQQMMQPYASSWGQSLVDKSMPLPAQISKTMNPYYQPYISAGTSALPTLQEQLNMLINDPSAFMSGIGSHYSQSPGYDFSYNQAMNAANQAASAGGMLGSPMHQQQASTMAQGLANKDYYDYLNSALGMYQKGLSGLGGLTELGYTSSNELAQSLANAFLSQAQLKAARKAATTKGVGGVVGSVAGALAHLFA
jgi:hypothetical protein